MQVSPTKAVGPGAISGFLNISIPSIPSRYIQPNLEADENDLFGD